MWKRSPAVTVICSASLYFASAVAKSPFFSSSTPSSKSRLACSFPGTDAPAGWASAVVAVVPQRQTLAAKEITRNRRIEINKSPRGLRPSTP